MVGRRSISNFNHPTGFGYIVIPYDSDRSKYIKTCLRKERVSIQLEAGGSIISNCYISRECLNRIKFPDSSDELGSAVAFIVPKFYDIPIIIGVISKEDETDNLEENDFKHEVYDNNSIVSIIGKGTNGDLFIDVNSEFSSGGNIFITLKNKENKANFNVKCFGGINIYAEEDIVLETLKQTHIQSFRIESNGEKVLNASLKLNEDSFIIEDKEGNKIESNEDGEIVITPKSKLKVFSGDSPLVKGDELKSELETMSNRIDRIIDALNAGSLAAGTIQTYVAAVTPVLETITKKEDFDNINSDKTFID